MKLQFKFASINPPQFYDAKSRLNIFMLIYVRATQLARKDNRLQVGDSFIMFIMF